MRSLFLVLAFFALMFIIPVSESEAGLAGACCSGVNDCTIIIELACDEANGFYQGDLSNCQPNPCIPDSTESCCSTHESTGCDNSECQEVVCSVDSFCCHVSWDGLCVEEATDLCGSECVAGPVVIIPTMGQWGMIFATIILGMFAVIRLRRKASE